MRRTCCLSHAWHGSRPAICRAALFSAVSVCWASFPAWSQGETGQPANTVAPAADQALLPLAEVFGAPAPATRPVRAIDEQPDVYQLYQAALELFDQELYQRTIERLDQALNLAEGDYYELSYLIALTKYRLKDYGQARTFAELAVSLRPGAADAHYLLGRLYHHQGQLERAIEQFRTVTLAAGQEPNNPRVTAAWLELGRCLVTRGYLTAACESYARFDEAIWDTHPEHRGEIVVARLLAEYPHGSIDLRLDLLRRLGRTEAAIDAAAEAVGRLPEDPYLVRLYVRTLLDGDQADEALAYCHERLAALTSDAAASPFVSLAVAAAQAADRLDEWLGKVAQDVSDGRRLELAAAIADRLTDAGLYADAVRLWRTIAEQRPDDTGSAWALAGALRAAGELESGVFTLVEFARQHPEVAEVYSARFVAWVQGLKTADGPLRLVARLADNAERDFATDVILAITAGGAGADELAQKLFRSALKARPDFALAHVAWGRLLLADHRWEDARTQGEAALQAAPDLAAAHFIVAAAHAGLDENDEAAAEFQAALKYGPDDAGYALAAARFYLRTDNLPAAQRYFQQAFNVDPVNAEAIENLIDSYLGGGKGGVARAQLRKAEACDLPPDALRRIRTILRFSENPLSSEHLAELARQFDEFPQDQETGLRLAAGLYIRGRVDDAFAITERVLALDPNDERAMVLMARLCGQRLAFSRATELLEELAHRYPNRPNLHALLAESYLMDFRLDDTRETFRHLLTIEPDEQARRVYRQRLVMSYVEFSEFDRALTLLDEWIAEEPDQDAWVLQKLRVMLLAAQNQAAIDLAAERLAPATHEFRQIEARYRETIERFQAAPDDLDTRAAAERVQVEFERAHRELSQHRAVFVQVCMDARRFETAETHIRQWQADGPEDGQSTQWLVQVLVADDRPDEALEALKAYEPATPQAEAALRGWRARAEAAAGRIDRAVEELKSLLAEDAVVLDSGDRADVWEQLLRILENAGRYDEALQCCDEWFRTDFDTSDDAIRALLLSRKCTTLMLADRQREYVELAEQWLKLDPDNVGLNNDLGYSWAEAGQNLEQATRMIRRAVAAEPLRAAYLDSLGWAYYKAGDFSGAQEYLGRAVRLRAGQDPVLYDHLADAEYRLGDHDAARRHWQRGQELMEEQPSQQRAAAWAELLAEVRAKLSAVERSEPPPLAPTADEQGQTPD